MNFNLMAAPIAPLSNNPSKLSLKTILKKGDQYRRRQTKKHLKLKIWTKVYNFANRLLRHPQLTLT